MRYFLFVERQPDSNFDEIGAWELQPDRNFDEIIAWVRINLAEKTSC